MATMRGTVLPSAPAGNARPDPSSALFSECLVVSNPPKAKRRFLRIRGKARDRSNCAKQKPRVRSVVVSVALRRGKGRCRHLQSNGRLGKRTSCKQRVFLPTRGRKRWKYKSRKVHLRKGKYAIRARAIDARGNIERKNRKRGKRRNFRKVRIR